MTVLLLDIPALGKFQATVEPLQERLETAHTVEIDRISDSDEHPKLFWHPHTLYRVVTDDAIVDSKALARTYSPPSYEDPWECAEDYQRVLEYTGRHPNAGSQRVAKKMELPRGRIRPWVDDNAIPDVVRGIQTAETNGWLPLTESSDRFGALNRFTAAICAAGSIKSETFGPYIRVSDETDTDRAEALFDALGLECQRHDRGPGRSTELRPKDGGAVLGRVLTTIGVPTDDDTITGLPWYLDDVSDDACRRFARTYLDIRGTFFEFTGRYIIEHQNRSEGYRRTLSSFLSDLGADVEVHPDTISVDAAFVEASEAVANAD